MVKSKRSVNAESHRIRYLVVNSEKHQQQKNQPSYRAHSSMIASVMEANDIR